MVVRGRWHARGRKPGEMNGTEKAYALHLDERKAAGEIASWAFEPEKFRLAPATYYTPDIDTKLETILWRAIQRNPRDRYETAAQLLADLKDPAAVVPRDPNLAPRRGFRFPRRLIMPLVIVSILAALSALIWLSAKR